MINAVLERNPSSDQGTPGTLKLTRTGGESLSLLTLELPWRDNRKRKSCIPTGNFPCVYYKSPSKGYCYLLQNVPDRQSILIHAGNWAGDEEMGFFTDSRGCILVGFEAVYSKPPGYSRQQLSVIRSRKAMSALLDFTQGASFLLQIRWKGDK